MTVGTSMFLVGSIQRVLRPVIRLIRSIHLHRIGTGGTAETSQDF